MDTSRGRCASDKPIYRKPDDAARCHFDGKHLKNVSKREYLASHGRATQGDAKISPTIKNTAKRLPQ
jgi:hypothetical protein